MNSLLKSGSGIFLSDGRIFSKTTILFIYGKKVLDCLKERKVDILGWPASSPDLNVIENVWSVIRKRLGSQKRDFENFEEIVYSVWNGLPTQYFEKFYESILKHLKQW